MKRSVTVADDFYYNPMEVRRTGLKHLKCDKPYKFHIPQRVLDRLENLAGNRITKIDKLGPFQPDNGSFDLQNYKNGHAIPIHHDLGSYEFIGIVYLTPDGPYDAGTSFWRHKKTELVSAPTPSDAIRLGTSVSELVEVLNKDAYDRRKWEEIDRVGYLFNRLVLFRSGKLHSTSRVFGRDLKTSRLTQVFQFSTL